MREHGVPAVHINICTFCRQDRVNVSHEKLIFCFGEKVGNQRVDILWTSALWIA